MNEDAFDAEACIESMREYMEWQVREWKQERKDEMMDDQKAGITKRSINRWKNYPHSKAKYINVSMTDKPY